MNTINTWDELHGKSTKVINLQVAMDFTTKVGGEEHILHNKGERRLKNAKAQAVQGTTCPRAAAGIRNAIHHTSQLSGTSHQSG